MRDCKQSEGHVTYEPEPEASLAASLTGQPQVRFADVLLTSTILLAPPSPGLQETGV